MAMPKFNHNQLIAQFQDFRQKLYNCFESCSDACMDLLDALAGNTGANSIAELSLNPLFPRTYNSLYKAIKASFNTNIQEKNKEEEQKEPNNLIRVVSELIEQTTSKGRILNITILAWHQMLMRGTKEQKMYRHPFTLIRVHVTDDAGNSVWKPMWLIVIGDQREEISPTVAYNSYRQRYDIEHMLRFGKQRLLMTEFQTPDVKHEENWIRLVMLAYVQLWAARELATHLPRAWERYLEQN
jgi:hypothetical protein